MRTGWKVLTGLGAVAGIVFVALVLGGVRSKGPQTDTPSAAVEPPSPAAAETNSRSFFSKRPPRSPSQPLTDGETTEMPPASAELATHWEEKVDQILSSDSKTSDKAKQMLEMFPRLPEAGQVEVAKHLSNLLPNEDYAPMGQFLANPKLAADVLDTLMADALNRPNGLKLPALLEVARTPQHPKAGDAKEMLGFFLDTDYGDDWPKWQEKLAEWLKENPD